MVDVSDGCVTANSTTRSGARAPAQAHAFTPIAAPVPTLVIFNLTHVPLPIWYTSAVSSTVAVMFPAVFHQAYRGNTACFAQIVPRPRGERSVTVFAPITTNGLPATAACRKSQVRS